jgi:L-amino acid N-acyltransferase YncA
MEMAIVISAAIAVAAKLSAGRLRPQRAYFQNIQAIFGRRPRAVGTKLTAAIIRHASARTIAESRVCLELDIAKSIRGVRGDNSSGLEIREARELSKTLEI